MPATAPLSDDTRICLDGEIHCTWGEFCADNADGLDQSEVDAIATALRGSSSYTLGGGAAGECTITLATSGDRPAARLSRTTRQNGIGDLIAKARARGAVVRFTIDAKARREEGRSLIASVTVTGLRGVGPHPMSPLGAVERLREVLAA